MNVQLEEEIKEAPTDENRELTHSFCPVCYPPDGDVQIALCKKDVSGEEVVEPGSYPDDCVVCDYFANLVEYCETCGVFWDSLKFF